MESKWCKKSTKNWYEYWNYEYTWNNMAQSFNNECAICWCKWIDFIKNLTWIFLVQMGVQPGNMWQQQPPLSSMNNPFTASNGSSVCLSWIFYHSIINYFSKWLMVVWVIIIQWIIIHLLLNHLMVIHF